jgi:CRP-like cAMP-binding protein
MSETNLNKYRMHFKKGEFLIREGEEGSEFYLLEKGCLDVLILGRKVNSIDANSSQEFIGEVGAVLGTSRTATIIAATDSDVLCFPRLEFETVLKNSPSIGVKLIRSLCEKVFNSASNLAEYQIENASILNSGNTEISLRNYMKGLLHLMEVSAEEKTGTSARNLLSYFLQTNPWGIQHGDKDQLLDAGHKDD